MSGTVVLEGCAKRYRSREVLADVDLRIGPGRSGGMRRRVALAAALLGDPDLLILDEPTTGLDPEQRMRFRGVVSELTVRATVLVSTHQTDDVAALCDRVVVLDGGRVRFEGAPAELAALAAGRVWLSDLSGQPVPAGEPAPAGHEVMWRTGSGQRRVVGDPPAAATLVEPTIEDGYLCLLGPGRRTEEAL